MTTPPELTEPVTPPAEPPEGFWQQLDQHIADALGSLFDTGKATVAEAKPAGDPARRAPDAGVAAEVKAAMAEVLTAEERRRKEEGKDAELEAAKAENARLKALTENPPQQLRAITAWMWGE